MDKKKLEEELASVTNEFLHDAFLVVRAEVIRRLSLKSGATLPVGGEIRVPHPDVVTTITVAGVTSPSPGVVRVLTSTGYSLPTNDLATPALVRILCALEASSSAKG